MSDELPEVDIEALHEAIKAAIEGEFPALESVDYYPRPGEKIATPAVFLELDSIDPDGEITPGTEQTSVTLRFAAYCVHDYRTGSKLAVRLLATALIGLIDSNRWGQPVGGADFTGCVPDKMRGEGNKEYEVMRIEWTHEALLGTNIWEDPGTEPTQVFISEAPAIGIPHEAAYVEVTE